MEASIIHAHHNHIKHRDIDTLRSAYTIGTELMALQKLSMFYHSYRYCASRQVG